MLFRSRASCLKAKPKPVQASYGLPASLMSSFISSVMPPGFMQDAASSPRFLFFLSKRKDTSWTFHGCGIYVTARDHSISLFFCQQMLYSGCGSPLGNIPQVMRASTTPKRPAGPLSPLYQQGCHLLPAQMNVATPMHTVSRRTHPTNVVFGCQLGARADCPPAAKSTT